MPKTAPIHFRLPVDEKKKFLQNSKNLGIPATTLLKMFIATLNKQKKVLFSVDGPITLEPFVPDDTKKIMKDFQKTKKYSASFLEDLEKGLERSRFQKAA